MIIVTLSLYRTAEEDRGDRLRRGMTRGGEDEEQTSKRDGGSLKEEEEEEEEAN